MTKMPECLGCRLSNQLEPVQIIYENEYVCCFLDIEPFNEGHTLILPKQHYLDVEELDIETAHAIMSASMIISRAIKKLYNPDGITICQNGGLFNDLSHYHMHVIPRYNEQPLYMEQQKKITKERNHLSETKVTLKNMIDKIS
ncbi:histidine triad (HIT) protein [Fictibacillus macauensis ZFHKF-1]|uniref:Histidine triad (HIT) protein n=1 Tax=Fictibacillus macauensis ZFHKF-1 TaxID=1196324 RepID=I8UAA7_9BACL|nr:HIT family protein [Fictibacillus macauensis]EIT83743.1 histidine triad (HIT) protein [Fictibacillus macauensis ZFHKF-1]